MMHYCSRLPVRLGLLACLAAGATLSLQAGQAPNRWRRRPRP